MRARQSGTARRIAPCALALRSSVSRARHISRGSAPRPAGVKVGIVGVMTIGALRATLAANVQGLRVAPLGPAIAAEASKLRAAGAEVVIVASHAGGRRDRFDQPADLSSCDSESEIFRWLRRFERLGRLVESSRVRSGQRRLAAAGVGCV